MSYQVLARKWRPRFFKEMVGQEHVLRALINALDNNRLHHAYLFTGTRGVGKTTIARILAKCLNCETGVTSEPCGTCSSCVEISEGRFVDLIEVDAASRTRVEDTRELLDNVQYAPTRGRFKVYLIDEVHMLSTHSFNALLKTLEEPPEHVKFLLATTDPQKLPVTILSRCLQFSLKNMSPERIVDYLRFVLGEEKVPSDDEALWHLGRAADGSMRDALSLTDQAIAFGQGQVQASDVSAMLGSIDRKKVAELVQALLSMDAALILETVAALAEHSPDYSALLSDLISFLHRIAVAQAVPAAVDNSQGDKELLLELAQQSTAEDIQLFYQSALIGRRDLPLVPDARSGLEMILLRMLAFRPQGIPVPPSQPLKVSSSVKKPEAVAEKTPLVEATQAPQSVSSAVEKIAPVANEPEVSQVPKGAPVQEVPLDVPFVIDTPSSVQNTQSAAVKKPVVETSVEAPAEIKAPPAQVTPVVNDVSPSSTVSPAAELMASLHATGTVDTPTQLTTAKPDAPIPVPIESWELSSLQLTQWNELFEALPITGMLRNIAANSLLVGIDANQLSLIVSEEQARVYNQGHAQRIQDALSNVFNQAISLHVTIGQPTGETPAQRYLRIDKEHLDQAVIDLQNDPHIQILEEQFSGNLLLDSVKPIRSEA